MSGESVTEFQSVETLAKLSQDDYRLNKRNESIR